MRSTSYTETGAQIRVRAALLVVLIVNAAVAGESSPRITSPDVTVAPRQQTILRFYLEAGDTPVVGLQHELRWTTPFELSDCEVNPAINKDASGFASSCPGGRACSNIALILSLDTVEVIPDGAELYSCILQAGSAAELGDFEIGCDDAFGQDRFGNEVEVACSDVLVRVRTEEPPSTATPVPTLTQRPRICPGDCDGNERVVIAEVIRAVSISLGENLSRCSNADVNLNAAVSIAEIIQAVSASLYGCFVNTPTRTFTPTASRTPTPTNTVPASPTPTRTPVRVTGCPQTFATVDAERFCMFEGRISRFCGPSSYRMGFTGLGEGAFLMVGVDPAVFIFVDDATPRRGILSLWATNADFDDADLIDGEVTLSPDGERLSINVTGGGFSIGGCDFEEYSGEFVGLTDPATPTPTPSPTPVRVGCPFDFEDTAPAGRACVYSGFWNGLCGDSNLRLAFSAEPNPPFLLFESANPRFFILANTEFSDDPAREADLVSIAFSRDFSDSFPVRGRAGLSDDGTVLTIREDTGRLLIDECPFRLYSGQYIGR